MKKKIFEKQSNVMWEVWFVNGNSMLITEQDMDELPCWLNASISFYSGGYKRLYGLNATHICYWEKKKVTGYFIFGMLIGNRRESYLERLTTQELEEILSTKNRKDTEGVSIPPKEGK